MKRIFQAALVAVSVAVVNAQDGAPAFPPAQVEVVSAEIRSMAPTVDISGTVISRNDSRIAAEVEGVLTWLADVGDAVEQGQTIARIDPRLINVAVKRARADIARLESDLAYRESQFARNEGLAATNHASATLLDEARALRDAARHQLAYARADLERAEGDAERAEIKAPFAGHVVERLASTGEYISVGEDVIRLVDTRDIEIALPAPIALAQFLELGQDVEVKGGSTTKNHSIRTVVPVGDAVSRMLEVRLNATEGDWLVGSAVKVSLPSAEPVSAVAVPRDALVERGGSAHLFKVADDGTAEQIAADIETTVGLWVGIRSGIAAGDQVIVRGAERLAPGQPVNVLEP